MSESIIFNFWIWIRYGVYQKVSDWIRIAKFPYPYTTGADKELRLYIFSALRNPLQLLILDEL